jgi:hypothetical protein
MNALECPPLQRRAIVSSMTQQDNMADLITLSWGSRLFFGRVCSLLASIGASTAFNSSVPLFLKEHQVLQCRMFLSPVKLSALLPRLEYLTIMVV